MPDTLILVSGEALVDLIPRGGSTFEAVLGGSPFNTAIGLGLLGVRTGFVGRLSNDSMGEAFEARLTEAGVDMAHVLHSPAPSPLAFVTRGTAATGARYSFYLGSTAYDGPSPLTAAWPESAAHLHLGSFSAVDGELGRAALAALSVGANRATTSFDPNIRPFVVPPREETLRLVEERVRLATVVKVSEEDLEWLYPDAHPADAAARWAGWGPKLLVLTRGGNGADAYFGKERLQQPAPAIEVVDTVGAGDSFMSALLAAMVDSDALGAGKTALPSEREVDRWLRYAIAASAITCTRQGAQPPTRQDLDKVLG